MSRIRIFLQRLLTWRNLAPITVIVGAIVGSLGLQPFGIALSSEQVILALLAFLALDALVERLEVLANIEDNIKSIQSSLTPRVTSDSFFRRRDSRQFETLLQGGHREIWVSGITLDTLATSMGVLQDRIRQGCNIRVLALKPDGSTLEPTADYFASEPDQIRERISTNVKLLARNLSRAQPGKIEIRMLDRVLTTGFVIVDASSADGRMFVQLYSYWYGVRHSPVFELRRADDPVWYPEYVRQYEKAWEDSEPYQLPV